MQAVSRRSFLETSAAATALALCSQTCRANAGDGMAYGLVTYLWGQDWDLATLIANCEAAGALGVELRTTHAHGVEPTLDDKQRAAVRDRFADSEVTLVGIGSNERFDDPNPDVVKKAIEASKEFIRLSHDVGSTGVKVKPDRFHPDVPREKTIEQIGKSLNELGKYADGFGQQIRLEVHGQCAELPTIKAIMDIADHPNVAVCWNSNAQDLQGAGLEHNLELVRNRFGATCHVRELDSPDYPYQQLINLLVKSNYDGWILLESSSKPADKVAALTQQVALFREMVKKAQG
ncbi:MAG: sugar phosphate isomerase/epimerase [Planctomycetaceae bacterium]|nr:sugar phosphate isomerase/epimerase [Planctomycetales bacterium]MCB9939327.1 sugar phosphate isomerase/epimerase [Planctomycetaceae bacterium]